MVQHSEVSNAFVIQGTGALSFSQALSLSLRARGALDYHARVVIDLSACNSCEGRARRYLDSLALADAERLQIRDARQG